MIARSNAISEKSFINRNRFWLIVALSLLGVAFWGLWTMPHRIGAEVAMTLQEAELLLQGAVPYCDFAETRQPLIVYLSTVPVMFSRVCGISPIASMGFCILVMLAVSGAELVIVMRRPRMCLPEAGRGLVLLVWIASYFIVDWHGDLGQQEHLFMLLYTPYLFLRILRYQGGTISDGFAILLGLQACVGVELKPLFLFAAINVEIVLLFAARNRYTLHYPEIFSFVGGVLFYWLHWLLVSSAMREAFFERWSPMANYGQNAYDAGYGDVLAGVAGSPISLIAVVAVAMAASVCIKQREGLRFHLVATASLAAMALLTALLQKKAWSCHYLPLYISGLLCLALLIIDGVRRWANERHHVSIGALHLGVGGSVLCGVIVAWLLMRANAVVDSPDVASLRQMVEQNTQQGDRVLVVSCSVHSAYPMLLQMERRPASRYLYSFPIAYSYSHVTPKPNRPIYRDSEDAPLEETQFLRELSDDVARRKPHLIAIENKTGGVGLPSSFNILNYLGYVGWTDGLSASYEPLPSPEGWKMFLRKE